MEWGRARSVAALALIGGLSIVLAGLVGPLGLGIAFALGLIAGPAIIVASAIRRPAIFLSAATADPAHGWEEFHRELARARRFDRSFGIVRFADSDATAAGETRVRDRVAAMSRRIDRVWVDGGDLFVLLPEADASAVEAIVTRARQRIGVGLGQAIVANFPSNGITSGALIASLYRGDSTPVAIGSMAPSNQILPIHAAVSGRIDDGGDVAGAAT